MELLSDQWRMAIGCATARGFHERAAEYWRAAEAVRTSGINDPHPKHFLWGRAIELVLKSFLLSEGVPLSRIKTHDIEALLHRSRELGIQTLIGRRHSDNGLVHILNVGYDDKRFEYPETGVKYYLTHQALTRNLIKRLLKGVGFHLARKGRDPRRASVA
jgi:hypothetical protein